MKILVTGSEGYIGTILVQELLKRGFVVTGLDTSYYAEGSLYDFEKKKYPFIKKDIREVTESDLRGFDVVIHLAELSNDPLGQNNPELTYQINHKGTMSLANVAKKAGVKRFIYASSCSVYGASDEVVNEFSATNPLTEYAKCKVLNEKALLYLADENFSPIILRNATVYGASPRMRFDLVVNDLTGIAYTTGEIRMESDGSSWRPFIHILDVCDAVIKILNASINLVDKQIFNVGDTRCNYQIRDVANVIAKVLPGCNITFNKNSADKRNYKVSFDKIRSVLGFSCARNLEYGARELVEIFKKIKFNKEIFESRNYTRLSQIKYLQSSNKVDEKLFWRDL